MVYLSSCCLVIVKNGLGEFRYFRRNWNIVGIANPEVTVYIVLLDVSDKLLPRLLLIIKYLLLYAKSPDQSVDAKKSKQSKSTTDLLRLLSTKLLFIFAKASPLIWLAVSSITSSCAAAEFARFEYYYALIWKSFK
jgi:hypothetical protein